MVYSVELRERATCGVQTIAELKCEKVFLVKINLDDIEQFMRRSEQIIDDQLNGENTSPKIILNSIIDELLEQGVDIQ